MTNYLRPDELATETSIKNSKRRNSDIESGLKTASSFAGASLTSQAASKILPFLSQYIPEDIAMKGINKVAPAIGKFLKSGIDQGLSLRSGLDYLKDEFGGQQQSKENKNIIQQYSPELHQFLDQEIKKGRSPTEAGAIAQSNKKFSDVIKKLSKDHKTDWSSIIQSVFGNGQTAQPNQQQPEQSQQQGQGLDPRVAQILQEGSQILKGLRGNSG